MMSGNGKFYLLLILVWNVLAESSETFEDNSNETSLNGQLSPNLESTNMKIVAPKMMISKALIFENFWGSLERNSKITEDFFESEEKEDKNYKIIEVLENLTKQNKKLSENVSKLETLLNGTLIAKELSNQPKWKYDEHFNAIGNFSFQYSSKSCSATKVSQTPSEDVGHIMKISQYNLKPFYAECIYEKVDENGWMIVQRRQGGSVDFNRNWLDYKLGFGNLHGEYWLGLERLHAITSNQPHELWIKIKDSQDQQHHETYLKFLVGNEDEGYILSLSGYSGDGAILIYHNSSKFTTHDVDNDEKKAENCAQKYQSGWWYNSCFHINLNYRNLTEFLNINGKDYPLKYVHMAIRPH